MIAAAEFGSCISRRPRQQENRQRGEGSRKKSRAREPRRHLQGSQGRVRPATGFKLNSIWCLDYQPFRGSENASLTVPFLTLVLPSREKLHSRCLYDLFYFCISKNEAHLKSQ